MDAPAGFDEFVRAESRAIAAAAAISIAIVGIALGVRLDAAHTRPRPSSPGARPVTLAGGERA